MSQISLVNGYSLNIFQNKQLARKYNRHKIKIQSILNKRSQIDEICREQKRISQIVNQSRAHSRNFRNREFQRYKSIDLSCMRSRVSRSKSRNANKSVNQDSIMTSFQNSPIAKDRDIQKQILPTISLKMKSNNKNGDQILSQDWRDHSKYKKKLYKEIKEYERIRKNMQRFKIHTYDKVRQILELKGQVQPQQQQQSIEKRIKKRKVLKTSVDEDGESKVKKSKIHSDLTLQLLIV